jgi:hypothetical protein
MKIDRTQKDVGRSEVESGGSRAQRVRRILDDQRGQGGYQRGDRFQPRDREERERGSVSDDLRQRQRERRGPSSSYAYAPIDLFGSRPLGIFKKGGPTSTLPQKSLLPVWDAVHAKELQLAVTHPPANGFEEMILWTNQGKLWNFPINNEQGNFVLCLYHASFVCAHIHAYMRIYACVCIPMLFKGRNHIQIQSKCKIIILYIDQNLSLFRMVHFVLL